MADKKTVGAISAVAGGIIGFVAASLTGPPTPAPNPAIARYSITGTAPTVRHASLLHVNLHPCRQPVVLAASDAIDVTRHGCLLRVSGDYAGRATIQIVAFDTKGREIGDGYYQASIKP